MTIVLVPTARPETTGPTAIPDHVPPAWLDGSTIVLPRRTVPTPAAKPIVWQPAGEVRDLVHVRMVPKAKDDESHGELPVICTVAAALVLAAACLWAAHTSPDSSPAPITPAPGWSQPSHEPTCDQYGCELRVEPASVDRPMTLGEALGMAVSP